MQACVLVIDPIHLLYPLCDRLERNDIGSSFFLLWGKAGKVGKIFLNPSASIAQMRRKVSGQHFPCLPASKLKGFTQTKTQQQEKV